MQMRTDRVARADVKTAWRIAHTDRPALTIIQTCCKGESPSQIIPRNHTREDSTTNISYELQGHKDYKESHKPSKHLKWRFLCCPFVCRDFSINGRGALKPIYIRARHKLPRISSSCPFKENAFLKDVPFVAAEKPLIISVAAVPPDNAAYKLGRTLIRVKKLPGQQKPTLLYPLGLVFLSLLYPLGSSLLYPCHESSVITHPFHHLSPTIVCDWENFKWKFKLRWYFLCTPKASGDWKSETRH